jgi:hypothetical protein
MDTCPTDLQENSLSGQPKSEHKILRRLEAKYRSLTIMSLSPGAGGSENHVWRFFEAQLVRNARGQSFKDLPSVYVSLSFS